MRRNEAESAKRALSRARVLDVARRPVNLGEHVLFPVLDAARAVAAARAAVASGEADAVEGVDAPSQVPFNERDPGTAVARRLAAAGWSAERLARVPERWEKLGDVVVLKLPLGLARAEERELAEAFAEALGAKSVLADEGGVAGEFREMRARFLLGDDAVATHVENGILYRLDASRLMFSSGNVEERQRAAGFPARGETVVDCFAGIGYFTLPVAVHAGARRVVAIEKNPLSHRFLAENVRLNGVEGVVEPWLGDNRDYPEDGFADRVLLGYVGRTREFLDRGLRLLKPEGGVVHYHTTCPAHRALAEPYAEVQEAAARRGLRAELVLARKVKGYSPGMVHAVADVRVGPKDA